MFPVVYGSNRKCLFQKVVECDTNPTKPSLAWQVASAIATVWTETCCTEKSLDKASHKGTGLYSTVLGRDVQSSIWPRMSMYTAGRPGF